MGVATMAELIAIVLVTFATNFLCKLTVLHSRIVDSLYLNSCPITVAIMPGDETEGGMGASHPSSLENLPFRRATSDAFQKFIEVTSFLYIIEFRTFFQYFYGVMIFSRSTKDTKLH